MGNLVIIDQDELKSIIKKTLIEYDAEKSKDKGERLWTINQVAKRLGKAHATIKKLVANGLIRTTKDGLIPESSLEDYLKVL